MLAFSLEYNTITSNVVKSIIKIKMKTIADEAIEVNNLVSVTMQTFINKKIKVNKATYSVRRLSIIVTKVPLSITKIIVFKI
jgi:hypothetical protein